MSTNRRARRRCAGSRRGGHDRGRDFACGVPVRCARVCAGETDPRPAAVQPIKLRTQRWQQLLAFMHAGTRLLGLARAPRLYADFFAWAGYGGAP